MSTTGQNAQQLQQELQLELTTANQLLSQISAELRIIKSFTQPGGDFEATIKDNAALISQIADLKQVDLTNIPEFIRKHLDTNEK